MPSNLAPKPTTQTAIYEPTRETERLRDLAYLGRLLSRLRAHWVLFVSVFAGFVALVAVATLLVPKQYTATVKMIVGGVETQADAAQKYSSLPVLNALTLESSDVSSNTVAELVQEGPVVNKVIQALNLKTSPASLLSRITVKPVLNTPVLSLSATWKKRDEATAIANTFADVFIARQRDLVSSQAVAAEGYLKDAIAEAQARLATANSSLEAYQAHSHIADISVQTQGLLGRLETMESRIDELRDDQKQAAAQLASAQTQLGELSPTTEGQQITDVNPAATQLRAQLTDVEGKLAADLVRYTPKYPEVIKLERQREELKRAIAEQPTTVAGQSIAVPNPLYQQLSQQAATLRSQIEGDKAQLTELQDQRKRLDPEIAALPAQTANLGFLQERAKLALDVYNALEQKYDDAVVAANSAISDVTVVQSADANDVTVSPNLLFNLAVAVVLGLFLALLAVAIVDAIQRRIREDHDVERAIGLPVIAHIPSMTTRNQHALPWLQMVTIEAFLHLCASLRIVGNKSGSRVIVITSPGKGDGKSTIAYNLANAMSRIRTQVLLIDADMRCPSANVQAQIENQTGLADVLSESATFDEAIVSLSPTLDILTAGTIPENPVALIESPHFDQLLELARQRYQCVIVDTPAIGAVVDPALIAAYADATALVISANSSRERSAGHAADRLRSLGIDNVLGVIMNRASGPYVEYGDYFSHRPQQLIADSASNTN